MGIITRTPAKERNGYGNDDHTVLLIQSNGISGSNYFVDNSYAYPRHNVVAESTVCNSQAIPPKFGDTSIYINNGVLPRDCLRCSGSVDWELGNDLWTIDFWAYPIFDNFCILLESLTAGASPGWSIYKNGANGRLIFYTQGGSQIQTDGGVLPNDQWTHVALVHDPNIGLSYYISGVMNSRRLSTSINPPQGSELTIGDRITGAIRYWGYLDQIRISKGIARWPVSGTVGTTSFTLPNRTYSKSNLYPGGDKCVFFMSGEERMDTSNTFTEWSRSHHTVTRYGDTERDLVIHKINGASWSTMPGNGNGDYFQSPTHSDFIFDTNQDFTIDFWLWPSSTQPGTASYGIFTTSEYLSTGIACVLTGTNNIQVWRGANILTTNNPLSTDIWTHVAIARSGSNAWNLYINGVSQTTTYNSNAATICPNYLRIMGREFATNRACHGCIDSFRITKGEALWGANFSSNLPLTRMDYEG